MIHGDNPFVPDADQRDPVRRFRGRLASPVTIVTAGDGSQRAGLTVSSLNVIEGDPGSTQIVVGPTTELWSVAGDTGRFIIHVCRAADRHLTEVFAGIRPNPGGIFTGITVIASEWGPIIDDLGDRVYCSVRDRAEIGYSGVITGTIDRVDIADLADPLVYFRGRYRSLGALD